MVRNTGSKRLAQVWDLLDAHTHSGSNKEWLASLEAIGAIWIEPALGAEFIWGCEVFWIVSDGPHVDANSSLMFSVSSENVIHVKESLHRQERIGPRLCNRPLA